MEDQSLFNRKKITSGAVVAGAWVAGLWAVFLFQFISGIDIATLGIFPKSIPGSIGILTGPWVHVEAGHILSNTFPLFLLTVGMFVFYPSVAWRAIVGIYFLTGVLVWIFAKEAFHIGVSGVVYGMASFLFFSGIFRKDMLSVVVTLIVAFLYGGMAVGLFPLEEGISWESHLLGALSGGVFAFIYRKKGVRINKKYSWEEEPDDLPGSETGVWDYEQFLPPKEQRNYWNWQEKNDL